MVDKGEELQGLFFFSFHQLLLGGDAFLHICHSDQQHQGSKKNRRPRKTRLEGRTHSLGLPEQDIMGEILKGEYLE